MWYYSEANKLTGEVNTFFFPTRKEAKEKYKFWCKAAIKAGTIDDFIIGDIEEVNVQSNYFLNNYTSD